MSLLAHFLNITKEWKNAFLKTPSHQRAIILSIASLCTIGRACLSRFIGFLGLDQQDWSAHYKLFSRSSWDPANLFKPILHQAQPLIDEPFIAVAFDDTKLKKTGKKIKTAFYQRDPLSPPFHINLIFGLRFLQASLLVPMYRKKDQPPRALPISFEEVPCLKKPRKKATAEELAIYKQKKKTNNLSTAFTHRLLQLRNDLDEAKQSSKELISVVDGSFCNQICMRARVERTCIVARARKDASLCFRAKGSKRKIYANEKFTPEKVRQDEKIEWKKTTIYHSGKYREVRFKEIHKVLWQRGTKDLPLRLIVIAPIPYRLTKKGKLYYRKQAYLLIQPTELPSEALIQKYFDRWQIEVNHREEKDTLGVGQAQVRAIKSVPRQPAFVVAAYSALLLAGIKCYEEQRSGAFMPLPKWRRRAKRPSCLDLIQVLRRELGEKGRNQPLGINIDLVAAVLRSAA